MWQCWASVFRDCAESLADEFRRVLQTQLFSEIFKYSWKYLSFINWKKITSFQYDNAEQVCLGIVQNHFSISRLVSLNETR